MNQHEATNAQKIAQDAPLSASQQAKNRLGISLSEGRENKKMKLSQVSDHLRVHHAYLQGLESGDWSKLPEDVYVMGFLRQYAALVEVDVSQDMQALKPNQYKLTKPFTMPDPPIAMNRGWAIASGACFLLLLVLFNVVDEEKEENVLPLQAQSVIPAPPSYVLSSPESNSPPISSHSPVLPEAEVLIEPESSPDPVSARVGSSEVNPPMPDSPVLEPAELESEIPEKGENTRVALVSSTPGNQLVSGHRFRLSAVDQDVWLQLHAPNGELVKEALLRAGQRMELSSGEAYLMLTSGNPLALHIEIDGQRVVEAGMLGEQNEVLHDFHLTPPEMGAGNNNE
ncbi:MAG: DUF4115 domain-containing protein [Mariprofundaceae bacterium]